MLDLMKLKRISLKSVFKNRDRDFVPWLASPNNLEILSENIGMDLAMDIIQDDRNSNLPDLFCKDLKEIRKDPGVIIECQFGQSEQEYINKFLKYVCTLNCSSIIWIAEKFSEDHKAMFQWLNKMCQGKVNFFALEMEFWKIGQSEVAANFNIICRPINWEIRRVHSNNNPRRSLPVHKSGGGDGRRGRIAAPLNEDGMTETQVRFLKFWRGFDTHLKSKNSPVQINTALPKPFLQFSVGVQGIILRVLILPTKKVIGIEVNFWTKQTKPYYFILGLEKEEIEKELGFALDWMDMEGKQGAKLRVVADMEDVYDIYNESNWENLNVWFSDHLEAMIRVMRSRLKVIDPDEWINNKEN